MSINPKCHPNPRLKGSEFQKTNVRSSNLEAIGSLQPSPSKNHNVNILGQLKIICFNFYISRQQRHLEKLLYEMQDCIFVLIITSYYNECKLFPFNDIRSATHSVSVKKLNHDRIFRFATLEYLKYLDCVIMLNEFMSLMPFQCASVRLRGFFHSGFVI